MNEPIIRIHQLSKRFPGVQALTGISLEMQRGELHAVVGENGAGKSTLMKILAGVITEYEGELHVLGKLVQFQGTRDAEHAGIRIIHQELNLVEGLSAAANVFLGRELRNRIGFLDDREMQKRTAGLLAELECKVAPDQMVGQLRVGDQQLVEICKALIFDAEILIMDEPTSALTESETERLFRIIERLKARGVTIIYISHKLEEVFRLADRITVLRDGQLIKTVERKATNPRELTHWMVGREIKDATTWNRKVGESVLIQGNQKEASGRGKLLEVRSLSLPWPGHARKWRLSDINFHLYRGEVLGVAGLLGAGRTELLESIFGVSSVRPKGEILIDGRTIQFEDAAQACEAGLALVTEDRKRLGLFPNFDVGKNISLRTLHEYVSKGVVSSRLEDSQAESIVEKNGIKTESIRAPIGTLSGGNQQKAIIGRWLLACPKILLLDDPTRGIDVGAKAELYSLISHFCSEGMGVIITSSELPELLTLCDRIIVLCEGRLTGEFSDKPFSEQEIMIAATDREGKRSA